MKQLRRVLSIVLVILMVFTSYVAVPAAALANENETPPVAIAGDDGNALPEEAQEAPETPLSVAPEGGEETPLPIDETGDGASEPSATPEGGGTTTDAGLTDGITDGEESADDGLSAGLDGALEETQTSVLDSIRQPLEAITMEEFEELLALQPALTAEDMEAYLIRTEDEDGNGTVELYLSPVRYQTASGAWRMIDPEISVSTANGKQTLASADAPVRIDFLTKVSEDRLVTLSRDGYELSLVPVPQTGLLRMEAYDVRYLTGTATATRASGDTSASRTSYDGLRYEDVFGNGIDLVLTPTGTGLKEDIIFPSVPGQNSFSFLLDADGLTPVLREDGNAYLLDGDTSEIVAALPLPVMYDSSNVDCNFSYEIGVTIEQLPDGRYLYTLTPDRDWLTSSDRVYPVTLDPTVTYSGAS